MENIPLNFITSKRDAEIIVDRDGIVQFVNPAAEILFKRRADELVGELFGLPVVVGDRTEVDIIQRGGKITSAEMQVTEAKGDDEIHYIVASLRDITDRKLAEESLRLTERAIAASSNGILISDATKPDNPIIYVNPGFERITGYSASEAIGHNCRFLQGNESNQPGLQDLRQALKQEQECHVILHNYRKDGTQFWNDLYVSPVRDELGRITNFIGIQTDITERVNAEEKMRASELRLSTVLNAIKKGITFSDVEGKFELFNPGMEELTGYSIDEANACGDFNLLLYHDPAERQQAIEGTQQLDHLGATHDCEAKIRTKSGEIKYVLISSTLVLFKNKQMYLSAYRDITQLKSTEEQLRLQNQRERFLSKITLNIRRSLKLEEILQTTVDAMRDLLHCDRVVVYRFLPDWTGEVTVESVNDPNLSILGSAVSDPCFVSNFDYVWKYQHGRISSITDVLALNVDPCYQKLLLSYQIRANLVVPIVHGDKLWGLLIAHQCLDSRSWQEFEIDLLKQLADHVSIAIKQAELFQQVQDLNIHLEQQVEERTAELRQALAKEKELNQLKSQFVATASHEFRTPLATIQAASDLLKHYGNKMTETQKLERINKIQTEVKHMTELLEEVLTLGKVESDRLIIKPIWLDLEKFCGDTLEELSLSAKSVNHRFRFSSAGICRQVYLDPKLLRQILTNLISNAIKYSPDGGLVTVGLNFESNAVSIMIEDEGVGILPEDLEHIFESFLRGQNVGNISGTGLGLAIVKASSDLLGANITLHSEVNVGTKITVTIPTHQADGSPDESE